MVMCNPAFLRDELNGQLSATFNLMYGGIKAYNLVGAYSIDRLKTNVGLGISYLNYGNITQTDQAGNVLGNFRPSDYLIQLSASRSYEEKWQYGFIAKFIRSNYGQYNSTAIAMDAGAIYFDSSKGFQLGLVLANMGTQLKPFVAGTSEELPFDIQIGFSRKLAKAPLQFSVTAHHLNVFNIDYSDQAGGDDLGQNGHNSSIADKVLQHLVFGAQFYVEEKIEISAGYNHLRRNQLSVASGANGLTGFSMGIGLVTKKLQVRYSRSAYQSNTAYNQFGINAQVF